MDTSALAKLVVAEKESPILSNWIRNEGRTLVSSDLARTELLRAVRRIGTARHVAQARAVLDSIDLLTVRTSTFENAGRLDPTIMRSLDALHLANALELGDDLEAIVTYDERLREAIRSYGIPVLSPT